MLSEMIKARELMLERRRFMVLDAVKVMGLEEAAPIGTRIANP
jgi:hypothetical protein